MGFIKHINPQNENQTRYLVTGIMLIVVTTVLIVWFMPRSKSRQTPYAIGTPWRYGTVIAKYDFPIYKSDEALKEERDSLMKQFQPYFDYNEEVGKKNLSKFEQDFPDGLPGLPGNTKAIVADRLQRLYQAGVMDAPTYSQMAKADTTSLIRVVNGKTAESLPINCIYSTMTAYGQLLTDETLAADRGALQQLNLNNYIEPNLTYDKQRSQTAQNDLLSGISPANGVVVAGQKIVSDGELVTEYTYRVLASYERMLESKNDTEKQLSNQIVGEFIYVFILVLMFTCYLLLFRQDYFYKVRNIAMLYTLISIFPILTGLIMQHRYFGFTVYVLPIAFVPLFTRIFMDSRTANMANITTVLICAIIVKFQIEFIFVQTVAGLVTIYSLREMNGRAQVFKVAFLVFIAMTVSYHALKLIGTQAEFQWDVDMLSHFAIACVLILLAYPLMYVIEKAFGFISSITLIELSNTSRGLLRSLSEVAPGTFQHSIVVGNLAAEIANRTGANSTLVRTGALYHDIGKMINPVFFTENQQGGVNPHDNLTDKESAKIIINHIHNGVKIAEEANLPTAIIDFIRTSHGRSMCKYFYIHYQNEHPDEVIDKELFTYPGPNPYTLEQAILMMCDTCEAAARSLKDYSAESITTLVDRLIDQQVADGYFRECKITFYDIAVAKQVLIDRFKAIYHTRIQYPTARKPETTAK